MNISKQKKPKNLWCDSFTKMDIKDPIIDDKTAHYVQSDIGFTLSAKCKEINPSCKRVIPKSGK